MENHSTRQLEKCEKALGIFFRKRPLLQAALAHPSYRNENPEVKLENFERLEFFGDAILNYVICRKLYRSFPEADEGALSQLRSALVSRKMLIKIAEELRLIRFILLGRSELTRPKAEKSKILADSLEAIIAAVYLDRGLPAVKTFIEKRFERYFNVKILKRIGESSKTTLQELSQKDFKLLPVYSAIQREHNRFVASVEIEAKGKTTGEGRTKKEAEERAARKLLQILRRR